VGLRLARAGASREDELLPWLPDPRPALRLVELRGRLRLREESRQTAVLANHNGDLCTVPPAAQAGQIVGISTASADGPAAEQRASAAIRARSYRFHLMRCLVTAQWERWTFTR